jgi:hypothetical protein
MWYIRESVSEIRRYRNEKEAAFPYQAPMAKVWPTATSSSTLTNAQEGVQEAIRLPAFSANGPSGGHCSASGSFLVGGDIMSTKELFTFAR